MRRSDEQRLTTGVLEYAATSSGMSWTEAIDCLCPGISRSCMNRGNVDLPSGYDWGRFEFRTEVCEQLWCPTHLEPVRRV